MSKVSTVREQVVKGAALLDEIKPGWADLITRPLQMWEGYCCVLGQSFRDVAPNFPYTAGLDKLYEVRQDAAALGFQARCEDSWDELADAWVPEIQRRRTIEAPLVVERYGEWDPE